MGFLLVPPLQQLSQHLVLSIFPGNMTQSLVSWTKACGVTIGKKNWQLRKASIALTKKGFRGRGRKVGEKNKGGMRTSWLLSDR